MSTLMTIVVAVISSGIVGTMLNLAFQEVQKRKDKKDHRILVEQELLLWRIKEPGTKALHEGSITQEELQDLIRVYDLYKEIGGNGFAEAMMSKVKALPIKE